MFDHSELTVVKNSDGMPTALGYPINSALLQNNNPLFVGGGGKSTMAVPAGLVCMTTTTCTKANANEMVANEMGSNESTNVADANQQMMRKIVTISNLDNYVVVTNTNNTGNEYTLPTKKEINLHTQELKIKGIIKKDKKGKKPKE